MNFYELCKFLSDHNLSMSIRYDNADINGPHVNETEMLFIFRNSETHGQSFYIRTFIPDNCSNYEALLEEVLYHLNILWEERL